MLGMEILVIIGLILFLLVLWIISPVILNIENCNTVMLTVINGWQQSVMFPFVRDGSIIRRKIIV